MTRPENLSATLESRKLIAETPGLCVQILTLSDSTDVPRQYHTEGTDTFACLEGPKVMKITYGEHVLETGNTCTVPPNTPHLVCGKDGARYRFLEG